MEYKFKAAEAFVLLWNQKTNSDTWMSIFRSGLCQNEERKACSYLQQMC